MRTARYKETSAYTGVPEGTLRSLVSGKKIPHIRVSARLVLFDLDAIDTWLAERTVQPAKASK